MLERRNRLPQAAHERIDISKPSVAETLSHSVMPGLGLVRTIVSRRFSGLGTLE
jgi:hypothetical protein